ncbi:MAG: hypothetical protein HYV01_13235, partial [Deltaproteobacteria bacterium]|nr:hypothetical protein [Deltaproteobacteria bacterium]
MSLETLFKVGVTVAVTAVWLWGVRWLWTTQIDIAATVSQLAKKPFEAPGWVATRDPKKLYQDGSVVGDVTGEVREDANTIRFAQLANTGSLKHDTPIDY